MSQLRRIVHIHHHIPHPHMTHSTRYPLHTHVHHTCMSTPFPCQIHTQYLPHILLLPPKVCTTAHQHYHRYRLHPKRLLPHKHPSPWTSNKHQDPRRGTFASRHEGICHHCSHGNSALREALRLEHHPRLLHRSHNLFHKRWLCIRLRLLEELQWLSW